MLSRRLLPLALETLYRNVQLYSSAQLVLFAASIRAQPHLATVVKVFGSGRDGPVADSDEDPDEESDDEDSVDSEGNCETREEETSSCHSAEDDGVSENTDDEERGASTAGHVALLCGMGELSLNEGEYRTSSPLCALADSAATAAPYEPERLQADAALLRDLLRRLTLVEALLLFGRPRLRALLDSPFLREGRLDRVKTITLSHVAGDWDGLGDEETCHLLQLLPSLEHVVFFHNGFLMPFASDKEDPRSRLEPHSWALTSFHLSDWTYIGPEIKHLFAALKPGFVALEIQALGCHNGFARHMTLLPGTVEVVDLKFGIRCWTYDGGPLPSFDTVFTPAQFPSLTHLRLGGPLLSPSAIPSLGDLPSLRGLVLEHHVPLSGQALLDLLAKQPLRIEFVGLQICACVVTTDDDRTRVRSRARVGTPSSGRQRRARCGVRRRGPECGSAGRCRARSRSATGRTGTCAGGRERGRAG